MSGVPQDEVKVMIEVTAYSISAQEFWKIYVRFKESASFWKTKLCETLETQPQLSVEIFQHCGHQESQLLDLSRMITDPQCLVSPVQPHTGSGKSDDIKHIAATVQTALLWWECLARLRRKAPHPIPEEILKTKQRSETAGSMINMRQDVYAFDVLQKGRIFLPPEKLRSRMFTEEGFGVCVPERAVEWEARVVFNNEDARTRAWEFCKKAKEDRWRMWAGIIRRWAEEWDDEKG
ncbi:hypothetical protein HDV00_010425 [Rhizophlyctis rosea]|nr:hypothetical protein HDV00_010425 [Rhizophlyctis rosea]